MHMKNWMQAAAAIALAATAAFAHAETAVEAKALLAEAHAAVVSKGMSAAAQEFNAGGKWKRGKAYVVLVQFDRGTLLAHADNPKLAGKSMLEAKDASGKAFVHETIQNVKAQGESLVDYRWANPTTKKIDNGHLLARRVPGQDAYVAVGFWD
jgi:cytochrome c